MRLKQTIKKIIFGSKADSTTYINHLRDVGMTIGERVNIYDPRSVCIDETRPFLIKIGDDVKITRGVTMLTHGYDWSVLAGLHDIVLGSGGGDYCRKQCVYWHEYNHPQGSSYRE